MVQFAVCDDQEVVLVIFEKLLKEYKGETDAEILLYTFNSEELLKRTILEGQFFDVVFLDVELEKNNGVEVGKWIRESCKNERTEIVYISAYERYSMNLFYTRPFDFILKPLTKQNLYCIWNRLFDIRLKSEKIFKYTIYGINYKEKIGKILYFRSNLRKIEMFTVVGKEEFVGKIDILEKQEVLESFIRVHQSYLVNPNYIERQDGKVVLLKNGEEIPISRKYKQMLSQRMREWMAGMRR